MKIAVLGGSFNPVHIGHLALADDVCVSLDYDKVIFVPSFKSPHKEMNGEVSALDRLKLLEAACSKDSRFEVDDCEIKRGGISYTCETLKYLEKKYGKYLEKKIALILGSDLFSGFHLWKNASEIAENYDLILARRPKSSENSDFNSFSNKASGKYAELSLEDENFDAKTESLFKNALYLENPLVQISSTEIRARIANGLSFKYLVPQKVFKYIKNKGLYEN